MAKKRTPIVAGATVEEVHTGVCPHCNRTFEQGPLVWDNPKLSMAALGAWVGERVTVTIAQEVQKRSLRANAYLWSAVYPEAVRALNDAHGEAAMTAEFLHHEMKKLFNGEDRINPITGEVVRFGKSTKDLPVEEFGHFIESVMLFFAERYGISFQPPRANEEYRDGKAA